LVNQALRGMGAVAAGLIIATAIKLLPTLKGNPLGGVGSLLVGALTFVLVAVLRLPLWWVVLGLGSLAVAVAWLKLKQPQ
jgi:chromate transporter